MNVITLSREHHAGGGEFASRLAEALGWEVLDRELVHRAAAIEHIPDAELDQLDEQASSLAERLLFAPPHAQYVHGVREAARQAAARGQVILVGRGMRHLLGDAADALHVRLVAPLEWRAERGAARTGRSLDEARARCQAVDQRRERYLRYFFGRDATQPSQFDLVINVGRVPVAVAVAGVAALVRRAAPSGPVLPRLLTLTRPLGAEPAGWSARLATRLGLRLCDPQFLRALAARLGVSLHEIEQVDEQPGGFFQRLFATSLHNRYFKALAELMGEEADRGGVLLVGRGAACFLRDQPGAVHVCLTANHDQRLLAVMRERWLREDVADALLAHSDTQRRRFHEVYFHSDWMSPLGYHVMLNAARLGDASLALVAALA